MLQSLPVSNSGCDRIFSNVCLIKTKNPNRLITSIVSNIIIVKKDLESNCIQFLPDSEKLIAFNSDMFTWYFFDNKKSVVILIYLVICNIDQYMYLLLYYDLHLDMEGEKKNNGN